MLKKWKTAADHKKKSELLTDLSKAFDCLSHDLPLAKLDAHGFSLPALRQIQGYLSNRTRKYGK